MNDIRLIALDMDGTLLDGPKPGTISEQTLKILHQAEDAGIQIALCSGRIPGDLRTFAILNGLRAALLGLNGACTMRSPQSELESHGSFTSEEVTTIVNEAFAAGATVGIFRENDLITSAPLSDRDELIWATNLHHPLSGISISGHFSGYEDMKSRGIQKIIVYNEEASVAHIGSKLRALLPQIEISSSWVRNLELNPKGIHKGTAVLRLAEELGLTKDQVMTIGDNDNDAPMLRCCRYGVAMQNATPAAIDAAAYLTRSCSAQGVSFAIRSLIFGENLPGVRAFAKES